MVHCLLLWGAECVNAYVEWTPLGRLAASGLLRACAYLLMLPAHRLGACAVLRQVSARKQAQQVAHPLCAFVPTLVGFAPPWPPAWYAC